MCDNYASVFKPEFPNERSASGTLPQPCRRLRARACISARTSTTRALRAIERIASELLAAGACHPAELRSECRGEGGYVTPKVEVPRSFAPADGKVLLVR